MKLFDGLCDINIVSLGPPAGSLNRYHKSYSTTTVIAAAVAAISYAARRTCTPEAGCVTRKLVPGRFADGCESLSTRSRCTWYVRLPAGVAPAAANPTLIVRLDGSKRIESKEFSEQARWQA